MKKHKFSEKLPDVVDRKILAKIGDNLGVFRVESNCYGRFRIEADTFFINGAEYDNDVFYCDELSQGIGSWWADPEEES